MELNVSFLMFVQDKVGGHCHLFTLFGVRQHIPNPHLWAAHWVVIDTLKFAFGLYLGLDLAMCSVMFGWNCVFVIYNGFLYYIIGFVPPFGFAGLMLVTEHNMP